MTLEIIRNFLMYCTLLNYGIVAIWFLLFYMEHDWLYRLHSRWFSISAEKFDSIHYAGMAIYKVGILLFNLVPFVALCLVAN